MKSFVRNWDYITSQNKTKKEEKLLSQFSKQTAFTAFLGFGVRNINEIFVLSGGYFNSENK